MVPSEEGSEIKGRGLHSAVGEGVREIKGLGLHKGNDRSAASAMGRWGYCPTCLGPYRRHLCAHVLPSRGPSAA